MCASCSIWSRSARSRTWSRSPPRTGSSRRSGCAGCSARARPGIAALLASAGVDGEREIDARTIAWKLAPRINAPGRLGAAEPSLALLLADHAAAPRVRRRARGGEHRAPRDPGSRDGRGLRPARAAGRPARPAIVIAGEGWPTGVVGIIASKLVDLYHRPAFVIGLDPVAGIGRGSARTVPGVNLYEALASAAGLPESGLQRYGGHAAAAGFTVQTEAVASLAEALGEACAKLAEGSGPVPTRPRCRCRGPARRGRRASRPGAIRPGAVRPAQSGAAARHPAGQSLRRPARRRRLAPQAHARGCTHHARSDRLRARRPAGRGRRERRPRVRAAGLDLAGPA